MLPHWRLWQRLATATGLRVSDLLNLRKTDLAPILTIVEHKTGKTRSIPLSNELLRDLKRHSATHSEYVFEHKRGGKPRPYTRYAVAKTYKRLRDKLGIADTIAAHSMRKVYVRRQLAAGKSIADIREDLKHKHIETTLVYALGKNYIDNLLSQIPDTKTNADSPHLSS